MNQNSCFIDTGAFYASLDTRDQNHKRSLKIWEKLENTNIRLITSNHILDELATLLARKIGYEFSALQMYEIYTDAEIHIERSTHTDELKALALFKKYADQKISFTDCISFAIMERLNIQKVFGFDRHFRFSGFDLLSEQ